MSICSESISSLMFTKYYGELTMSVENPQNIPVSEYVLYHKISNGSFTEIQRFTDADFTNNSLVFQDKYLEEGKTYSFKLMAYGASNQLLGSSPEIQL